MKVKLMKVSTKSFVLLFSTINVCSGFVLGAVVTVVFLLAPSASQDSGEFGGPWAILTFPIINGLLGLIMGLLFTGMYNFFAKYIGGLELEFETL